MFDTSFEGQAVWVLRPTVALDTWFTSHFPQRLVFPTVFVVVTVIVVLDLYLVSLSEE